MTTTTTRRPKCRIDATASLINQTITFDALGDKTFGDADFSVSASSDSNLAVSFAATGNCTVTDSTVHLTGAGSCTITASQAGDSNYNAATDVPRTFTISNANQTITVDTHAPANAAYNTKLHSGRHVQLQPGSRIQQCRLLYQRGPLFTMTSGSGTCTVKYDQAGDANYNPATQVTESVTATLINQAALTLTASRRRQPSTPTFTVDTGRRQLQCATRGKHSWRLYGGRQRHHHDQRHRHLHGESEPRR